MVSPQMEFFYARAVRACAAAAAAREAASADKAAAEGASASTLKNVASTLANASTPVKVVGGILVLAGVACGGVKLYSTSAGTRPTQRVNENPGRLGPAGIFHACVRSAVGGGLRPRRRMADYVLPSILRGRGQAMRPHQVIAI